MRRRGIFTVVNAGQKYSESSILSNVELLKFHRERQAENRRLFGADYHTDLDLVFCDPAGQYLKPDSIPAKACLVTAAEIWDGAVGKSIDGSRPAKIS